MDHQTDLQTQDPRLPRFLRDSKLPWKPRCPYQAPALRPDDAWSAHLGGLCFNLEMAPPPEMSCGEPPLTLTLRRDSHEVQTWYPTSLAAASQIADALVDLLLEQLRSSLQGALRDS